MRRVFVVVEGQTEEQFIRYVLQPHLLELGIDLRVMIVATRQDLATGAKIRGGGHWRQWRRDIVRLLRSQPADVRVTTLFDLYGLPGDFPGVGSASAMRDTVERATALERAMVDEVRDGRLIPYLQRHEFEALLYTDLSCFRELLSDSSGLDALMGEVKGLAPEDINCGSETAPSKRLIRHLGQPYRLAKATFGQLVAETIGLPRLRAACPRFNGWVVSLESLAL